jgi:glycosyltransferase 2 family protein
MQLFFFVVPMGLLTTAIPVAPGGLGVGQAAFFSLFQLAGHPAPVSGAYVCLMYQSVILLVYLSGLDFYLPQHWRRDSASRRVRGLARTTSGMPR